jgi:undecaprenyl diphosphate synthase
MPDDLVERIRLAGEVPRHVAIIMDGNGRWATERSLPRPIGHQAGMKSVREVVEAAIEVGVEVLTLFAFSQENWQRPPEEIDALMTLLEDYIAQELEDLRANGVTVNVLGDLERLAPSALTAVDHIMTSTVDGSRLALNLCISYSARAELTRAARLLAEEAAAGNLDPTTITEDMVASKLLTAAWPDPDLLIRTSGEMRISNFLLWQLAYAEIIVSPVLWPDFDGKNFFEAILDYQGRERRFGRVTL